MRFARRADWDLRPNPLAQAVEARRGAGLPIIDLTVANPTDCGLRYPEDAILAALNDARALHYQPTPRGLREARDAVSRYYADKEVKVSAEQVLLTASTSEAYAAVFKLLCDPGDAVLVPEPSYPLFDFLAGLDGVHLVPYALRLDAAWRLDLDSVAEAARDRRVRAVLVVSPNNPTGSFVDRRDWDALASLCAERQLALVCDEVFADYDWTGGSERRLSAADETRCLTLTMSGLSKVAGLPQLKLGWLIASGPGEVRDEAMARLEVILDTYLSVGAPVQHAAPRLLELRHPIQHAIAERVQGNRHLLEKELPRHCRALPAAGGWYAVIELAPDTDEDELIVHLVRDHGVLVHPGHFFSFPRPAFLVVSLLVPPAVLESGLAALSR